MTSTQTSMGEVDAAVYSVLTGDSTLVAMLATPLLGQFSVFDFGAVPEGQPFPYITIGDNDEKSNHAFGTRGYLTMRKLHIWDSQYGGFQKSQQILARMNYQLDQQPRAIYLPDQLPLVLPTQKLVYFLYQGAIQLNDPGDNKILHISVEYESFTQEQ